MMLYLILLTLIATPAEGFLWWGTNDKCYGDLGEFKANKPYNNAKGVAPQCRDKISVEFRLYTHKQPTDPQLLDLDKVTTITGSNFQSSHKTVFIVHGYQDQASAHWVKNMVAAFLQKEHMNVIAVDWSKGADSINYYQAAANTRVVGALIAEMMTRLHDDTKATYGNMHVVGHSLGAHIGGYAGERVPGLGRITGLDPAGPCFEEQDVRVRLDPNDANYVDVIHTDGDSLLQLGFGCDRALGHADFYPNGGLDQPGCPKNTRLHLFSLMTKNIWDMVDSISCSHGRAVNLFIESITSSCPFQSFPCAVGSVCNKCKSGCASMGYTSNPHSRGTFYLKTNSEYPFCVK